MYLCCRLTSFHKGFIAVSVSIKCFTTLRHVLRCLAPPNMTGFSKEFSAFLVAFFK